MSPSWNVRAESRRHPDSLPGVEFQRVPDAQHVTITTFQLKKSYISSGCNDRWTFDPTVNPSRTGPMRIPRRSALCFPYRTDHTTTVIGWQPLFHPEK